MQQASSNLRRFWWVNQNQTYKQELAGGYLWSPKRKSNGSRNPFYEFMREVSPGDIVFSFKDTLIKQIGVATDYCFEAPKPDEFGNTGPNWNHVGWKVPVKWNPVVDEVHPSNHIDKLGRFLPSKYSPLSAKGYGFQAVYLTSVPTNLAMELSQIIGPPLELLIKDHLAQDFPIPTPGHSRAEIDTWEDHLERKILVARDISETEQTQTVKARRGQGEYRANVLAIEKHCRVTGVDRAEHLIASHCKPWRDCENSYERLDGENGLMLTPTVDHLFDRGFIGFEGSGKLIISPCANTAALKKMKIPTESNFNVGNFSEGQKDYLEYHLEQVLLKASVSTNQ